jgi:hypothetical protein
MALQDAHTELQARVRASLRQCRTISRPMCAQLKAASAPKVKRKPSLRSVKPQSPEETVREPILPLDDPTSVQSPPQPSPATEPIAIAPSSPAPLPPAEPVEPPAPPVVPPMSTPEERDAIAVRSPSRTSDRR